MKPTEVAWEFEQDADCCDMADNTQRLRIELHDGGGGHYPVLMTERWACEPEELRALADRLEAAAKAADEREKNRK